MESFILKNNVKVLFDKTNGAEIVSLRVVTPVSVISEDSNNAGISSLTSKLMIHSTKNRSSKVLSEQVGNIGADLSSDASYDMAGFSMSCLSQHFDSAAEILCDVILNPIFDKHELAFEKENAIAALNSRKDNIGTTATDEFSKAFYSGTSYAFPVTGKKNSITQITRDDLLEWHRYSYNASNILISVAGNISKELVKKPLEKYFSAVKSGDKFKDPNFNITRAENIRRELKGKFKQAYIFIGFPAPVINDKSFVATKVLSAVLGSRMTSRLFVELREKLGLAYEVSAVYPSRKKDSYFAIYIGLDKKNIDLTLKRIDEILKNSCCVKVHEQELENVKAYIKGMYLLGRQTINKKSYYDAWREIIGQGYKYDVEYLTDVMKVTTQDILDVAKKIFNEKPVSVVINPEE